MKVKD